MATLRDIKRKIGSINSTQTITRTMKMVSASKLRRAEEELGKVREYALKMDEFVGRVVRKMPNDAHPLLAKRDEIKKVLVYAIASDRGLCGSFNINVGLNVENFIIQNRDQYEQIDVYLFGRKLRDYLRRRKIQVVKDWVDIRTIDYELVDMISSELLSLYTDGTYDKIYIVYTYFRSPIRQEVVFEEFLPISTEREGEYIDYLCEPAREEIIEAIIPRAVWTKIYYALVESQTSEHAARMNTMENATSNCGEMISYLTLVYNKRRQESITSEMLDIVGGAEALRGM